MTKEQKNEIEMLLEDWCDEVINSLQYCYGARSAHTIVDEIEKILENKT